MTIEDVARVLDGLRPGYEVAVGNTVIVACNADRSRSSAYKLDDFTLENPQAVLSAIAAWLKDQPV